MSRERQFTITLSQYKDEDLIQLIRATVQQFNCSENKAVKAIAKYGLEQFKQLSNEQKAIALL